MMNLDEHIKIKCFNCDNEIEIDKEEYEPDITTYDHGDDSMGEEIMYQIENTITCEECGNTIEFSIQGSEYPIGAFNSSDKNIENGEFINDPQFEMVDSQEDHMEESYDADYLKSLIDEYSKEK